MIPGEGPSLTVGEQGGLYHLRCVRAPRIRATLHTSATDREKWYKDLKFYDFPKTESSNLKK